MDQETKRQKARRKFTDEFKVSTVRLVLDEVKPLAQVARDLDLTLSSFRNWVERERTERGHGRPGALNSAERKELARLRLIENERCDNGLSALQAEAVQTRMGFAQQEPARSAVKISAFMDGFRWK